MSKAIVVRANGKTEPIELGDKAGEKIWEVVGGWFDVVRQPDMNISAYVHDTGLIDKLDPNACVSAIFNQLLVGDIVICGATDEEGDHLDLHEMFFEPEFANYAHSMNNKPAMNAELAQLRDKIASQPMQVQVIK
jgi:hypothetical protein